MIMPANPYRSRELHRKHCEGQARKAFSECNRECKAGIVCPRMRRWDLSHKIEDWMQRYDQWLAENPDYAKRPHWNFKYSLFKA